MKLSLWQSVKIQVSTLTVLGALFLTNSHGQTSLYSNQQYAPINLPNVASLAYPWQTSGSFNTNSGHTATSLRCQGLACHIRIHDALGGDGEVVSKFMTEVSSTQELDIEPTVLEFLKDPENNSMRIDPSLLKDQPWFVPNTDYYCIFKNGIEGSANDGEVTPEGNQRFLCGGHLGLAVFGFQFDNRPNVNTIAISFNQPWNDNTGIEDFYTILPPTIPPQDSSNILERPSVFLPAGGNESGNPTPNPILDVEAIESYSRFFERQLEHYKKLFELQEKRFEQENNNFAAVSSANLMLIEFWNGEVIIEHNKEVLRIHRDTGRYIFWIAVVTFIIGIILAGVQFIMAFRQQGKVKADLESVHFAKQQASTILTSLPDGVKPSEGTSSATLETARVMEKAFEHEVEAEFNKVKLVMRTNALGVIILGISCVFFALYIIFVFPISFPAEGQTAVPNKTIVQQTKDVQEE